MDAGYLLAGSQSFFASNDRNDDTLLYSEQNRLPDLKQRWTDLQDVNSKVLQKVVARLYRDRSNLAKKAKKGYKVGKLKWKGKGYYHSFEYNQSGHQKSPISGDTLKERAQASE